MRFSSTAAALGLALVTLATEAQGQSLRDRLKKIAKDAVDSRMAGVTGGAGAANGAASAGGSGEATSSLLSAPRNKSPKLTGVWTGVLIAPGAEPNRYDIRMEITDLGGTLSGQTRISVAGKPLQYVIHSIDGTAEDGVIRVQEVNKLKEGSSVPWCAASQYGKYTSIVRNDGQLTGEVKKGYCGENVRIVLRQVSDADPAGVIASVGETGVTPTVSAPSAPTAPASPAATMVSNPNVTGTWTGLITQPQGNPNRYRFRLELTQKNGVITGTARTDDPDQPLRFVVQSVEGTVEEGIITLNDTRQLRHGTDANWCEKRSVLMLKTDGTLTGEWGTCSGGGNIHLTKAK